MRILKAIRSHVKPRRIARRSGSLRSVKLLEDRLLRSITAVPLAGTQNHGEAIDPVLTRGERSRAAGGASCFCDPAITPWGKRVGCDYIGSVGVKDATSVFG